MDKLYFDQQRHFERLEKILTTSVFAGDFSVMGAGKTYTTCALAHHFGLPLLVVAPRPTLQYWRQVAEEMSAEVWMTISYESLRSTKGHQVKHQLLVRYDYDDGSTEFGVTETLRKAIEAGLLIVGDECQKVKNNTAQAKAFRALIRPLIENGGVSRIIFLSGTPFEDYDHAVNFFRLIGFIINPKLYITNRNGELILRGVDELIETLLQLQPKETEELLGNYLPLTKNSVRKFIFEAFVKIIVPYYTSAMPSPVLDYRKDVASGYYRLDSDEEESLKEAVNNLQKASFFQPDTETIPRENIDMSEIVKALWQVENKKIPIFYREASRVLTENPLAQVVIFVNFRETLDQLAKRLADFSPLIYDGRVRNAQEEDRIIQAFQEGQCRLLLANIKKGSLGISLHDIIGDRPRYVLISPTFSISDMHQASNRTYRQGLKSHTYIRVVYGLLKKEDQRVLEKRILNALAKKTTNLKEILTQQAREGVLFPGDYPEEINE